MKIKVLKHQSMSHDGHYVLRSIQNNSLPNVDLLIRECIQNSLDANLVAEQGNRVELDIITGSCDRKQTSKIFKDLTPVLNRKYSSHNNIDFMAIKDKNTTGLTGPLKESEVADYGTFGNVRKLIYELGKPQDGEGKGGSWGIGKTVYYRMGIGLVIFYSRIQLENGNYQSRMAAALVEDNNPKDNSIEPMLDQAELYDGKISTGIAWWGNIDKKDGSSYPITADSEINKVLEVFNIPAYTDDETGTCVIIPYIDREELERNANPKEVLNGYSLEDYLKLAVQRWYFPRLYNKKYPYGSYLDFRINGQRIPIEEQQPYFMYMKKLYNAAVDRIENREEETSSDIQVVEIHTRNNFAANGCAGVVSFIHVTEEDLKMLPPDNCLIPYSLIFKDEEDDETGNMCIICYCRNAGMIINYEVESEWTTGLSKLLEGEFLLAFFHPNGNNTLKVDEKITFDEYLRKTERSDHNFWEDCQIRGKKQDIITKIKKQVPKKILENFDEPISQEGAEVDTYLGGVMGKLFMPTLGYRGQRPTGTKPTKPRVEDDGTVIKTADTTLMLQDPSYEDDNLTTVTFSLKIHNEISHARIYIKAHTSRGDIAADDWEKNIGEAFPVQVDPSTMVFDSAASALDFTYIQSSDKKVAYGIDIPLEGISDKEIGGILFFRNNDSNVSVSIQADGKGGQS